jgi:hypothetical protein
LAGASSPLNELEFANADGDPAEDGFERVSSTVGRCNEGALDSNPFSAFEGVDLESESQ